jgi:hypothetical protein
MLFAVFAVDCEHSVGYKEILSWGSMEFEEFLMSEVTIGIKQCGNPKISTDCHQSSHRIGF